MILGYPHWNLQCAWSTLPQEGTQGKLVGKGQLHQSQASFDWGLQKRATEILTSAEADELAADKKRNGGRRYRHSGDAQQNIWGVGKSVLAKGRCSEKTLGTFVTLVSVSSNTLLVLVSPRFCRAECEADRPLKITSTPSWIAGPQWHAAWIWYGSAGWSEASHFGRNIKLTFLYLLYFSWYIYSREISQKSVLKKCGKIQTKNVSNIQLSFLLIVSFQFYLMIKGIHWGESEKSGYAAISHHHVVDHHLAD